MNPDDADKIREDDLFLTNSRDQTERVYDPKNKWNYTTDLGTIAHLIQPANTLSAEIDIAAQATVIRKGKNGPIDDDDALISCSKYGNQFRHSDPHVRALVSSKWAHREADPLKIGSGINERARDGFKISIADPVALWISEFHDADLKLD